MIVTAWNNGQHSKTGSGYGLKVQAQDRDRYFEKHWEKVTIVLPTGKGIVVRTNKKSFWNSYCRELIHQEIGQWLLRSRLAPWSKGSPPKLYLERIGEARFQLRATES